MGQKEQILFWEMCEGMHQPRKGVESNKEGAQNMKWFLKVCMNINELISSSLLAVLLYIFSLFFRRATRV